jgi:hypothetical protein
MVPRHCLGARYCWSLAPSGGEDGVGGELWDIALQGIARLIGSPVDCRGCWQRPLAPHGQQWVVRGQRHCRQAYFHWIGMSRWAHAARPSPACGAGTLSRERETYSATTKALPACVSAQLPGTALMLGSHAQALPPCSATTCPPTTLHARRYQPRTPTAPTGPGGS